MLEKTGAATKRHWQHRPRRIRHRTKTNKPKLNTGYEPRCSCRVAVPASYNTPTVLLSCKIVYYRWIFGLCRCAIINMKISLRTTYTHLLLYMCLDKALSIFNKHTR